MTPTTDERIHAALVHAEDLLQRATATNANASDKTPPVSTDTAIQEIQVLVALLRDIGESLQERYAAGPGVEAAARKRIEDWLEEAHVQLEERVAERTAAFAQANRALQREIAERKRAEKARRDLLYRIVTAAEEERRRISRELHDQTGQYLTALSLGLRALRDGYPPASDAEPLLERINGIVDELGTEVHRMAIDLRPTVLDDLGLPDALRSYAESWSKRTGIATDIHAEGAGQIRLPGDVETTLYRVAQEALNNVAKHAEASRVSILFHHHPTQTLLIVEDNGLGFDANGILRKERLGDHDDGNAARARPQLGLLGIQERISLIEGTFTIESEAGRGATLYVLIPLQPSAPSSG